MFPMKTIVVCMMMLCLAGTSSSYDQVGGRPKNLCNWFPCGGLKDGEARRSGASSSPMNVGRSRDYDQVKGYPRNICKWFPCGGLNDGGAREADQINFPRSRSYEQLRAHERKICKIYGWCSGVNYGEDRGGVSDESYGYDSLDDDVYVAPRRRTSYGSSQRSLCNTFGACGENAKRAMREGPLSFDHESAGRLHPVPRVGRRFAEHS